MPASPDFPRVQPFGETAALLELGDRPDLALNVRVHAVAARLRAAAPPGVLALVPGYASLLVELDPRATTYEVVAAALLDALGAGGTDAPTPTRLRLVPTVYGGEHGPDLAPVARRLGLSPEDVVRLHTAAEQRVYMLGFSPGFPYLGDLPAALALPRRATPRERVPVGSVAIAGRQTGIYTHATPGGWHLLGRTPLRLFDPLRDPPTYLAPGDRVRFVPIPAEEWPHHAGPPADW